MSEKLSQKEIDTVEVLMKYVGYSDAEATERVLAIRLTNKVRLEKCNAINEQYNSKKIDWEKENQKAKDEIAQKAYVKAQGGKWKPKKK